MSIMGKFTRLTLKKNKSRTIVTIIGIILSLSMFTAVTTSIASLQNFLINIEIEDSGNWHGVAYELSEEKVTELQLSEEVDQLSLMQGIGFATLPDSKNPNKPFIQVSQVNDTFLDEMSIHLVEGKLPTNANEIIIDQQINTTGQLNYKIGDTITYSIGALQFKEGYTMRDNFYINYESLLDELTEEKTYTFTITGFIEKPVYETYDAIGYSAITLNSTEGLPTTAYFTLKQPKTIFDFMEQTFPNESYSTNSSLLRGMGISGSDNFNSVLYGFAAILIGIIMFGSISLIYNSFSISVAQRTKNFSLLKSIGATKRQILNSVLFEASLLSLIGIPLGILAGLAGIGVTLKLLQSSFSKLVYIDTSVELKMAIQWEALAIAAFIGYVTVLISAYLPALRASKVNVIAGLRQTNDIKLTKKQIRISPLTRWLFGFEGTLASKYFKRNKKSYRATVISISMSIILFISTSSFTSYLSASTNEVFTEMKHDLTYDYVESKENDYTLEDIKTLFKKEELVSNYSYHSFTRVNLSIPVESLSKNYVHYLENDRESYNGKDNFIKEMATIYFLDDVSFMDYVKDNQLDTEAYLGENPAPLVFDDLKTYFNRYLTFNLLNKTNDTLYYNVPKQIEGYQFTTWEIGEDGNEYGRYIQLDENGGIDESSTTKLFLASEVSEQKQLVYLNVLEEKPFGIYSNGITFVYPMSSYDKIIDSIQDNSNPSINFYLKTENPDEAYNVLNTILTANDWAPYRLYNAHEEKDTVNALLLIVNVFCYGFITLISFIALANIFNTISTNILLRRRDFAMLRSVGMTMKCLKKMLNLECLLYGLKGLLYGIPVSLFITYFIFLNVNEGLNVSYKLPWMGILVASFSVFIFVFGTMLYTMQKVKKDNPMETLRNENL